MSKKDENSIVINCWWDICLDNQYKTKYYTDNLSFFDKIAEHISDLLGIDFFIPFSSYNKIRDTSYRNPNYIFLEDCDRNKVFDNLITIFNNFDVFVGDTERLKENHFKLINDKFQKIINL